MADHDPGPPAAVARHLAAVPAYGADAELFWYDWGPIFYRGRLNRSARLLCIASDPGPTERIAGRTLVGDAGQRVQGFVTKVGLTSSYAMLNAHPYALLPSRANEGLPVLAQPAHRAWRNRLYDLVTGPKLQAIVAFGGQAQEAVSLWDNRPDVELLEVPHPSSRNAAVLAKSWRAAVTRLRGIITPDPDGVTDGPNYGTTLVEADYAPIPKGDLPFGLPAWFGDDAWGRKARPKHNNCVERSPQDFMRTLVWQAPRT